MAYSDKVWKDSPDHTTPLSAAGLNDWEARIKAETDALEVLAATNTARLTANIGQRALAQMEHDTADVKILVVSDSTANDTTEWPYLVLAGLAARYPKFTTKYALWNDSTHTYPAPSTVQTGTGTHTITLYNCSVSSRFLDHFSTPYFDVMAAAVQPDLVFVSHGHNAGTSSPVEYQFRDMAIAYHEMLTLACPLAEIVWIAENADASGVANGPSMQMWSRVLGQVAALRGAGFINAWQAFTDAGTAGYPLVDPSTGALIVNDGNGIHPNATGSALWAALVLAHLTYNAGFQPRPQLQSSLAEPTSDLLTNGDFANYTSGTPSGWTASGCTFAQDATNYESTMKGYSLRVQSSGAATARMYQGVTSDVLARVKGRPVCFAARLRSKSGTSALSNGGQARLRISTDGTGGGSVTSFGLSRGSDGFRWVTVSLARVPSDATYVDVTVYADTGSSGDGDISVDRVTLAPGILPRDIALRPRPDGLGASTGNAPLWGGSGWTYGAPAPAAHASAHAVGGTDRLTALDIGEFFASRSSSYLGTLNRLLASASVTVTSGVVYGALAIERIGKTYTKVRFCTGSTVTSPTKVNIGMHDSSGVRLTDTGDISATVVTTNTVYDNIALGASQAVAKDASVFLSVANVSGGFSVAGLSFRTSGQLGAVGIGPNLVRSVTGYTTGNVPTLTSAGATAVFPWIEAIE